MQAYTFSEDDYIVIEPGSYETKFGMNASMPGESRLLVCLGSSPHILLGGGNVALASRQEPIWQVMQGQNMDRHPQILLLLLAVWSIGMHFAISGMVSNVGNELDNPIDSILASISVLGS